MQKIISLAVLTIVCIVTTYCQTPAILNSPIPRDFSLSFADVNDVKTLFNNGRRMEESQFCLPTNSIPNLTMPSQSAWNNMNSDEKFLYLANAERIARAGLNYCQGDGPVKGLPFTGIEANIDDIAQTHAEFLVATQSLDEESQAANIDANPNIGGSDCELENGPDCCHDSVLFSVYRISFLTLDTPSNPNTITTPGIEAHSVYSCVYGDGGVDNCRKMLLLQDIEYGGNPSSPRGFTDDYGDPGDEGFLGIGLAGGIPHPSSNRTHIDMMIISYFDPVPQSNGCNYNCTSCDPCQANITLNSNQLPSGNIQASRSITTASTIGSSAIVNFQAGLSVELKSAFEVKSGGVFNAFIDGCYFSMN
jgi:hypothetical protein